MKNCMKRVFCLTIRNFCGRSCAPARAPEAATEAAAQRPHAGAKPKPLPHFVAPVVGGRVIRVYDGDTITIASRVPGLQNSALYQFSVRLRGIDTPEMRTTDAAEKQLATLARDALREQILDRDVELRNVGTEKYGRLLADVYFGGRHLNAWLVEQRYALPYDGGTKVIPVCWLRYHTTGER